jgi:hypothetical protein
VPTATVHRTDSASAPGTAPYCSRSWLCRTTLRWSGRKAPIPSGRFTSTGTSGQATPGLGGAAGPALHSARLPAPKVTQPSSGQVGWSADCTDSEPIEPRSAIAQSVGVLRGLTSSQRSPGTPATIT